MLRHFLRHFPIVMITLLLLPCSATAGDFSFDGRGTDGNASFGTFNKSSGGYSSGSSSGGGGGINPASWSAPGQAWSGRALPPAPEATVIENRGAHDQSMLARAQARLADEHYQQGYTAAREHRFADAEVAFRKAKEHRLKTKELAGGVNLDSRLKADDDAIAWAGTMQITANLATDLYTNATPAKKALEKLLTSIDLADARQSLLRAEGGELEKLARAHLREGRWQEALDAFTKAGERYAQAQVNAKRLETESKGEQRFPYNTTLAGSDLTRARQSQATAMNGVVVDLERGGKIQEAYQLAKQAAALWPEQTALQENLKRLGNIPVGFEKPAQGNPVELKP